MDPLQVLAVTPEPCTVCRAPEPIEPRSGWLPQVGGYRVPAAVYDCPRCLACRTVPVGPAERRLQ